MSKKRITDVGYSESLNNNDSLFVNQGDILRQITKQDLFSGIQTQITEINSQITEVNSKMQFVYELPENPDPDTYYFIPE